MSQRSQELSPSFFSGIYGADLEEEIFQQVGSQDMRVILNTDLSSDLADGPYATAPYGDNQEIAHEESTMSLEDMKFFTFAPQLNPLPATEVLSNDEYLGPHDFEVSVLPNPKSKNPWVYSCLLNKVYMDMSQQFPVDFKIKHRPNKPIFVRTTPQYSAQHHAGEAVCRCIQHDHYADPTNKDIDENVRQHVIRCSNNLSYYVGDTKQNQRLSVVFPLALPQAGSESVRELFHFVCKSSCPAPGMNRRGIEVIFTLEDERGTVLGRKCLKVRICACPKRDKEKEENEVNKSGNPAPRGKKRRAEHPPAAHPGKVLPQQDDHRVYTLNIVGKQNMMDVLNDVEKLYKAKAYDLQGHVGEQAIKKVLAEVQSAKRLLQQ